MVYWMNPVATWLLISATLLTADPYAAGLQRYRTAEYAQAAELFRKALGVAQPPGQHADVAVHLGLALFNLGDIDGARLAFDEALGADPHARLPDDAPPKAGPVFDEVRLKRAEQAALRSPEGDAHSAAASPASTWSPAPEQPSGRPALELPPAPDTLPEVPAPDLRLQSGSTEPRHQPPLWVASLTAVAAAGLGVGAIALQVEAGSNFGQASRESLASRAVSAGKRAYGLQEAATASAAGAVGFAVATGVLYLLAK